MKRKYVLDAGVLVLYFAGRKDAKKYIDDIYRGVAEAYMCEVNVAEFLYNYARVFGWEAALVKHSLIRSSPIKIVEVSEELTLEAARLKFKHHKVLSLADCYLIALAKQRGAKIITTDTAVRGVREVKAVLLKL